MNRVAKTDPRRPSPLALPLSMNRGHLSPAQPSPLTPLPSDGRGELISKQEPLGPLSLALSPWAPWDGEREKPQQLWGSESVITSWSMRRLGLVRQGFQALASSGLPS